MGLKVRGQHASTPDRGRGPTPVHVALLRGINVAGKNSLPMSDLVTMFERAGGRGVRSYIQSGNLIYQAESAIAGQMPARIAEMIRRRFGFTIPVVTRTSEELRAVATGNPFLQDGAHPRALHVAFLADAPSTTGVARLDPKRSPPDRFVVRGREIYLLCPNGLGRSKLTNQYFDTTLGTTSTVRNWNTVLKLLELAGAPIGSAP